MSLFSYWLTVAVLSPTWYSLACIEYRIVNLKPEISDFAIVRIRVDVDEDKLMKSCPRS